MQVTPIPLSPHHQPQAPLCKCEPLVRNPMIPSREKAESFLTFRQRDSFWWQHQHRDQIEFDICCRDVWQAGKHRGTSGEPWHRSKVLSGEIRLYPSHVDDARRVKRYVILLPNGILSSHAILLIDDTKSRPQFPFVFLICSHPFSLFSAYPPPTSPPSLPPDFAAHLFPSLFSSQHHKAVNPSIHSAFISSSQRRVLLLSCHSNESVLIPDFQHPIKPIFHYSNNESCPYSIIPGCHWALCTTFHSARDIIPSFKERLS